MAALLEEQTVLNIDYEPEKPPLQIDPETLEDTASLEALSLHGVTPEALTAQQERVQGYRVHGLEAPHIRTDRMQRARGEAQASLDALDMIGRSTLAQDAKVAQTTALLSLPPPEVLATRVIEDAALTAAASYVDTTPAESIYKQLLLDSAEDVAAAERLFERDVLLTNQKLAQELGLDLETAGDLLGTAVPLRYPLAIHQIAQIAGIPWQDRPWWNPIFTKGLVEQINTKMKGMAPAERVQTGRRILDAINSGSLGSIESNTFLELQALNAVFYDIVNEDGRDWEEKVGLPDVRWTLWLDNVGELLNWTGAYGIIRGTAETMGNTIYKLGNRRAARVLINANPTAGAQTLAQIASGDANLAKALNVSQADVLERLTPTSQALFNQHVPPTIADRMIEVERAVSDVRNIHRHRGLFFADSEKEAIRTALETQYRSMQGLYYDASNSVVKGDDFITVNALFTQAGDVPFTNIVDAVNAAESIVGKGNKFEILGKTPAQTWEKVTPSNVTGLGEFKVQIQTQHGYNTALASIDKYLFGNLSLVTEDVGHWNQWLRDPDSIFGRSFTALFNKAALNPKGISSKLEGAIKKEFSLLNMKSKRLVLDVLAKGDEAGEVYDIAGLQARGLTTVGEVRAYMTYRQVADASHELANELLRTELQGKGFRAVYDGAGNALYARPLDAAKSTSLREALKANGQVDVYNAATSSFVSLTRADIEGLVRGGGAIGRLRYPATGSKVSDFVAVTDLNLFKTLPRNILNKRTGYVPRIYTDPLFIALTSAGGARRVLATAPNEIYAQEYISSMLAANPGWKLEAVPSREMASTLTGRAEIAAMLDSVDTGRGLIWGQRKDYLPSATGIKNINIVDPLAALEKNIDLISRAAGSGEFLNTMEARLFNYMKKHDLVQDIVTKNMQGKWWDDLQYKIRSGDASFLREAGGGMGKQKQLDSARSYLELINRFTRTNDKSRLWIRKQGLKLSNYASSQFARRFAPKGTARERVLLDSIAWWSEFNPTSWLSRASFDYYMAGNPLKQVVLQGSQFLLLAGLRPKQIIPAMADMAKFAKIMTLSRGEPKAVDALRKSLAGVFGVKDVDEAFATVKYLGDSGYFQQIDSHFYRLDAIDKAAALRQGKFANMMNAAGRPYTATTQFLGKVGFDLGEQLNRAMTFAITHRKFMDDHGGRAARPGAELDAVIGESLSLLGNTTAEAGFQYQRNLFKLAFQFWSFQHKMFLMTVPGAGKALSLSEKLAMSVGQLILFGSRAVPTSESLYQVMKATYGIPDMPPDTQAAIEGGIADYLFLLATDDDSNIRYSIRNAPSGGVIQRLIDTFSAFAYTKPPGELMFGPSAQRISALWSAYSRLDAAISLPEDAYATPEDKWVAVASAIGQGLYSGLNYASKLHYQSRLESFTDRVNKKTVPASQVELVIANLLGGSTEAVENYYDASKQTNLSISSTDWIDDTAKVYTDAMRLQLGLIYKTWDETGDPEALRRVSKLFNDADALLQVLDREEAVEVKRRIGQLFLDDIRENKLDSMAAKLVSMETERGLYGFDLAKARILRSNPKLGEALAKPLDDAISDIENGGGYAADYLNARGQ